MSDARVLELKSMCEYTGVEKEVIKYFTSFKVWDMRCLEDGIGNTRVLKYEDGKVIAGFILNKCRVMSQMYTAPHKRKQGIMKGMLAVYKLVTEKPIYWDDNLTEDGKVFVNSYNN